MSNQSSLPMRCCLILVLFSFTGILSAQQNPTFPKEVEARIKLVEQNLGRWVQTDNNPIILQERIKLYNLPGLSIAVVKDYKLDWARGYGWADTEKKIPVNTHTLFQAASISKSLNGIGVLKLAQDKKVDLHIRS